MHNDYYDRYASKKNLDIDHDMNTIQSTILEMLHNYRITNYVNPKVLTLSPDMSVLLMSSPKTITNVSFNVNTADTYIFGMKIVVQNDLEKNIIMVS